LPGIASTIIIHTPYSFPLLAAATNYFLHPTAVVDEGAEIGAGVHIWHFCHLMPGCRIGADCNLGQSVFVGAGVVLGRNVKVQNNVSLYEGVICEDDVFLGPSMVFTNVINPRSAINRKSEYRPTYVRRGATIGANATIICGNEVGAYAFVGAGAVVTKPVPPYALVVGSPARQIGWMSAQGGRLHFGPDGMAVCPVNGSRYELIENQVIPVQA
jgi:UDP-2-acetamido-3-amino-2,3-dideoxy-glucuronate N-acetyltransferase